MNLKAGKIKFVIIATVVVVIILLALGIWLIMNKEEKPPVVEIKPPEEQKEKMASEKITIKSTDSRSIDSNRNIQIIMPYFENLGNDATKFQEYINMKMAENSGPYQEEINVIIDEKTPSTKKIEYAVDYDRYNNDEYISLVINHDYNSGGIRTDSWKETYNVDVVEKKEIFLADLFESGIDYKEEILKVINEDAKNRNIELVGGNGLSNIPDGQKFYIEDKTLVLYFDRAAIAPAVDGELIFEMPFEYKDEMFYVK